jgi:hypothetical protein
MPFSAARPILLKPKNSSPGAIHMIAMAVAGLLSKSPIAGAQTSVSTAVPSAKGKAAARPDIRMSAGTSGGERDGAEGGVMQSGGTGVAGDHEDCHRLAEDTQAGGAESRADHHIDDQSARRHDGKGGVAPDRVSGEFVCRHQDVGRFERGAALLADFPHIGKGGAGVYLPSSL